MTLNDDMSTPGNAFISGEPSETSQFAPVKQELGYDPSKYEEQAVETTPEAAPEVKTNKGDESHRLAQLAKTERKLQQRQKEAEAVIARAEQYKGAFETSDVVEALEKLGLKPNEIYRKLTDHVLKKPSEVAKDPMQEKLDEQERKLQAYEESQNKRLSQIEERETNLQRQQAINNSVAPVINNNEADFETLINVFGTKENVINEVYKQMEDEYTRSGEIFSAADAAKVMESYWFNQIELGLKNAQKLNKYKHYFKEQEEKQTTTNNKILTKEERFAQLISSQDKETQSVAQETKNKQSNTLTNNMNMTGSSGGSSSKVNSPLLDRNAYIDSFLKKLDR